MEAGHNSNEQLKSIVSRIENIESEIKERNKDKAEIYLEAKGNGFDVKALREAVKRRRVNATKRAEHEAQVDLYMAALESLVGPA